MKVLTKTNDILVQSFDVNRKCILVYEDGLKSVPTRKMWSLYLEYVLELTNDQNSLPNYRKNCLETAFEAANRANMLTEKYYSLWVCQHNLFEILIIQIENVI